MSIYDPELDGQTKHGRAISRIRSFCRGKKTLVAFSGGKDSQCCYHLCEEAGVPFTAQYSVTRFEPPELLRFIRENYPGVSFRRAYRRSLVEDIERRGPPSRWARWCCDAKHKATPGFDIAVVGVRAAESSKRAKTWREFGFKPDHSAYVCPIIDWTTEDVWEYLSSIGKPHCVLYDPPWNFRRIGCVCCPLASPAKMQRDAELWPKTAAMLRMGSDRFVQRKRAHGWTNNNGKPCADWCKAESPEAEFWTRWITTGQVTMSQKDYKNAQDAKRGKAEGEDAPCLFAGTGFSESDGRGEE